MRRRAVGVGVGVGACGCRLCVGSVFIVFCACVVFCVVGSGLVLCVRIVYVFCMTLVGAMSIRCFCVGVGFGLPTVG